MSVLEQQTPPAQGSEEELTQTPVNDGSLAPCEDYGAPDPAANDVTLQGQIKDLCRKFAQLDAYPRRTEVIETRRQRFYRRDDQYILENKDGVFGIWTGGTAGSTGGEPNNDGRLTDVYNIFWPYMRAFIALGTQNPAGVNFEPDAGSKATDINAARNAEIYRHQIDRLNNRKALQEAIFSLFCTDTRTIVYTRTVWDAQRFGTEDDGSPKCGSLMTAHGTLESKLSITATTLSETPYLILSDDPEECLAKQEYPQAAGEMKGGGSALSESSFERFARLGVLQGAKTSHNAADAFGHLTVRHRVWLRPGAFHEAPDGVREKLTELYPKGMKVVWCGDAYCGSSNQSMDDKIRVGFPAPGDGMSRSSMMKSMVPLQDAYNDYRNMEKELFEHCIPMGWRNSELQDMDAMNEQRSQWGGWTSVQVPATAQSIQDCFYIEPPPVCPPSLAAAYNNLMGEVAQFITGAQPALFGGADKDNSTASGISMLRDQAMGQFGIAWGNYQELMAGAYKQGVIEAANAHTDDTTVPVTVTGKRGKTSVRPVDLGAIKKGNFHSFPDSDSSFPETSGSKRQVIQSLVTSCMVNPEAVEAYGILEPENLEIQRQSLAIEGWIIPGANSADKQMGEIELLLKQRPTPDLPAVETFAADAAMEKAAASKLTGTGIPAPPEPKPDPDKLYRSSIRVSTWDFHDFEAKTIKDWLSSPEGILEAKINAWGILNVRCHGQEHLDALAKQAGPDLGGAPPIPGAGAPGPNAGPLKNLPLPSPGAQMTPKPNVQAQGVQ